jgi:hypothetical protein
MKIKIPKNEVLWVTQLSTDSKQYIITSTKDRSCYILYSVDSSGNITKIKKGKDPTELYDII